MAAFASNILNTSGITDSKQELLSHKQTDSIVVLETGGHNKQKKGCFLENIIIERFFARLVDLLILD